jgi:ribosomal protein S18 acetylase RimI-like enzyme
MRLRQGGSPVSSVEVRPFRREDREQLTALVSAHTAAVVPGLSVAVSTVLSQLEREPGEFIVDPWVSERATLVAEQRGRVVAAAHLLRYASDEGVGESHRGAGEIRWFLFWPEAPFWPDSTLAAHALIGACISRLEAWAVSRQYADGALPAPGVYGVPEQWPHVRSVFERAGFVRKGQIEIVYLAEVDRLPRPQALEGLAVRRSVGINGTRLSAVSDAEVLGYVEVDMREGTGRFPAHSGWADIGNLHVRETHRRRGIASWLVAHAADWLRLARVDRVLDYSRPEDEACCAFLESVGFNELTRTERGWVRRGT